MKRKLFACFLALTMLTVLTACGGKAANSSASASADTSEAMVPDYTENDSYASYTGSGSGGFDETESLPTDAAEQKIIYTGDLNLETTDFDAATRSLSALAEELGGYVENSSIGSSSRGYRWADYTIRIPSGQFQRFFEQVGELAHETWRSTNQEYYGSLLRYGGPPQNPAGETGTPANTAGAGEKYGGHHHHRVCHFRNGVEHRKPLRHTAAL